MALIRRRTRYMREFVDVLPASDDISESSSSKDGQEKKVLEELLAQSLLDLENRFKLYLQKLGSETDTSKLRDVISRSEKRLKARFYQEVQSVKRPKAYKAHRIALKHCMGKLEDGLYGNKLIEDLFVSKVVTLSEKSSIQNAGNRRRQNSELLTFLAGRLTYEEFHNTFLPALSKDHKHLADMLISEVDKIEEETEESKCVSCRTRQYVQVKRLAAPLRDMKAISLTMYSELRNPAVTNNTKWAELKHNVPDDKIINALEKKYPDFYQEFKDQQLESLQCQCPEDNNLVPEFEVASQSSDHSNSEADTGITPMDDIEDDNFLNFQTEDLQKEYRMEANPKGICLIINNQTWFASDTFVKILDRTFKRLQFLVETKTSVPVEDLKRTFKVYSKLDHSKYDAFICVYMGPGIGNGLVGSDDKRSVLLSDLTSYFKASLCPSLAGKPKIFIIESRRGSRTMDFQKLGDEHAGDDADFLIGHSTSDDCVSFRKGNIPKYLGKLTKTLDSSADQTDFLSCMTMTTQEVARRPSNYKGQLVGQVPTVVSTLTKKLHLTSDPLWPHPE